ncbi:MAG: RpiB/LacA/LacB family sugar-phosphate isomerase [Candidatus Zambryskibacteria bacterium]
MKIFFAADHAGFEMKNALIEYVKGLEFEVEDCGAYELNPNDDYPEFIKKAAQAVSEAPEGRRAIVLGGSGQGEAIVANKFPNVRAVEYYGPASAEASAGKGNLEVVKLSREHNNANVLSLGARFLSLDEAKEAVKLWLETSFSDEERHKRRISKIEN